MAESATQRHYRAPCPGCGAPVEFRSAQSTHAVCGYCQSTVVRSGDVLTRLGKMAELFDDHSPLQTMASGRITLDGKEVPFTLVGRLQYKGDAGVWTEWTAFLEDGTLATLGEDNGAYVFSRPIDPGRELPEAARWSIGTTTAINGKPYSVAYAGQAQLVSAQGELPKLPPLGQPFGMVELRSSDGEVLSIDYGHTPPRVERGRAVLLEDLQLQGLKDESAKDEKGRQFNCPHCGAPVQVQLASTKSITCGSCSSIIDLGSGVGGELRSAMQDEPVRPIIPLGAKGPLQGVHWQVVGFQHRMGVAPGDDEHFGWSEYLLYNQKRGFAFLVDSEEGWSMVRPTTGAPQMAATGRTATYLGTTYQLKYSYNAETTYVLGEFYWPVERGQKTFNRDFAAARGLLSMEQSASEITWSAGDRLASDTVVQAFGLGDKKDVLQRDDPGPFVAAKGAGCGTVILIVVVLLIVLIIMSNCSGSSGSSYRSSGGSFGGYSSGGSHK
ncbi:MULTISPECIES: DUF4178 domain-containing protein [Acidovorax]|uniref:DUF4178 domain-containing protein n=1 Tax=Acidovorax soli TaxID=592050 RepID=A0A1H3ZME5_9BURK|nr:MULTISPECIES: DUF4178 domain-containing protein [Acidovorax]SEA24818.1 protein of unknown function [Acidovorax soli]